MELIPKAVIAGAVQAPVLGFGPQSPMVPSQQPIPRDVINRIWSAVIRDYPYQSLQFEPTGRGAVFLGDSPQELVLLQPPVLQIRSDLSNTADDVARTADKIHQVLGHVLHQITSPPALNLGVKFIYNAPAPGGDAVAFARTELVKGDEDLQALAGGQTFEASIKVMIGANSGGPTRTLLIEPLHIDTSNLYIDLDTQFPGPVNAAQIREKVIEAHSFVTQQINTYLDARSHEWGTSP